MSNTNQGLGSEFKLVRDRADLHMGEIVSSVPWARNCTGAARAGSDVDSSAALGDITPAQTCKTSQEHFGGMNWLPLGPTSFVIVPDPVLLRPIIRELSEVCDK